MNPILEYGLDKNSYDFYERVSYRAIICRDDRLLMVATNQGDCMFPGGGIDIGEDEQQALVREVLEETGYRCTEVGELVCTAYERKKDMYEPDKYIALVSKYFVCKVEAHLYEKKLDGYERDLGFENIWITVDKAIEMNLRYRETLDEGDFWRLKTIAVLEMIKEGKIKVKDPEARD